MIEHQKCIEIASHNSFHSQLKVVQRFEITSWRFTTECSNWSSTFSYTNIIRIRANHCSLLATFTAESCLIYQFARWPWAQVPPINTATIVTSPNLFLSYDTTVIDSNDSRLNSGATRFTACRVRHDNKILLSLSLFEMPIFLLYLSCHMTTVVIVIVTCHCLVMPNPDCTGSTASTPFPLFLGRIRLNTLDWLVFLLCYSKYPEWPFGFHRDRRLIDTEHLFHTLCPQLWNNCSKSPLQCYCMLI